MASINLTFEVMHEEDGFSASCNMPGYGLHTQGDTLEELYGNLEEVALLYLDDMAEELGVDAPTEAMITVNFVKSIVRAG
ncbi:MAG: type II toxin-antitoxin system HicB family antitoxin [bacterium]